MEQNLVKALLRAVSHEDDEFTSEENRPQIDTILVDPSNKRAIATYFAELYRAIYPHMSQDAYHNIRLLVYSNRDTSPGSVAGTGFLPGALRAIAGAVIGTHNAHYSASVNSPAHTAFIQSIAGNGEFQQEVERLKAPLKEKSTRVNEEDRLAKQLGLLREVHNLLRTANPSAEDLTDAGYRWLEAASAIGQDQARGGGTREGFQR